LTESVKNSSDLLKEMLLRNGIAKIDENEITNDIEMSKLVNSGFVTVFGLVTYPDVLLILTMLDEEKSILKEVYEKGEVCVREIIDKIKPSRMRKWIESGLVGLEKRDGKLLLIKK